MQNIREITAAAGEWFVLTPGLPDGQKFILDRVAFYALLEGPDGETKLGVWSGRQVVELGPDSQLVYGEDPGPGGILWRDAYQQGDPGATLSQRIVEY